MPEKRFRKGDILFRAGDAADCAFCVREGAVEILAGSSKREVRVALLGAGEVFGEMALVEERPHALTARAASDGLAALMSRAEFEHELLHDPQRCRQYLKGLFERLRNATARLAEQGEETVEQAPLPPPAAVGLTLYPMTPRAAASVPDEGLKVDRLPFRVGRASGAHEDEALDVNDLWLPDDKPFSVSRNHLLIDRKPGGGYVVRDRGSRSGAWVNSEPISGKHSRTEADLNEGDNVVVVGGRHSKYQFKVTVRGSG
jgi:CRP/FNR family cyclic AMP-dependent transcriptional regulator